jgi:hypothetical protein
MMFVFSALVLVWLVTSSGLQRNNNKKIIATCDYQRRTSLFGTWGNSGGNLAD